MKITLRNKNEFHSKHLVLGTAGLGGVWSNVDLKESVYAIEYALDHGINVVDTAPAYNGAQEVLAEALKNRKGNLPLISTKAGRLRGEKSDSISYDYSKKGMTNSVENSLRLFGLDKIDILFLHDPDAIPEDVELESIVEVLLTFKERGYTKEIGLGGNFSNPIYYKYLNQDCLSVFQGYNRFNTLTTQAINEEFNHCIKENVMTYAASPLFMGLLGNRLSIYEQNRPNWIPEWALEKALRFRAIAEDLGEEMPGLAHRFLYSVSEIDRVVIGGSKLDQIKESLDQWEKGPLSEDIFNSLLDFAD